MAFYLSPLVDVNEIDLTTTIPAVATSIGCIILRDAYKGPERKKWLVTSEDDLIDTFGQPSLSDASAYQDLLAATGFLRWGNKLYCTRTLSPTATFSGTRGVSIDAAVGSVIPSAFVPFLDDGSDAYVLSDVEDDPDTFGEHSNVAAPYIFELIAASRGAWGDNIKVAVCDFATYNTIAANATPPSAWNPDWDDATEGTYNAFRETDSALEDNKDFLILVYSQEQGETSYTQKEIWNVSTVEKRVDDEGTTKFAENLINRTSKYIRIAFSASQKNAAIVCSTPKFQYFDGGVIGSGATDSQIEQDLDLYKNAEEVDVNIFIDSNKSETVKEYMNSICESRLDCMAVLDVPKEYVLNNSGQEVSDLTGWRLGTGAGDSLNINTSYSAVYANWLEIFDKWNNVFRWIPASGHAAGIFARTDDVTDPWFAPAGLQRGILSNVRRLAWNPSLGERDLLYKNGLNPIVSFAGQGKTIFGQKTMLFKNSAFNRINVRRLFIILEKAISTAVRNFLFEPNDEITRLLLLNLIDPFLRDVRSRRGIFDYLIVCDETNNTPERVDRNELWCDIYVKPTRAAEFIVLNFIATKTGASFTEIAALRAGRAN